MKKWSLGILVLVAMALAGSAAAFGGSKIANGSGVQLSYSLNADGMSIVSEKKTEQMNLIVGNGAYPVDFEKQLLGLKVGDKKVITLKPEQAFGLYRKELIKKVPLSAVPKGLTLREGDMIGGKKGQNAMRVVKVLGDSVIIDQNHPLAGKTLSYRVEVKELR